MTFVRCSEPFVADTDSSDRRGGDQRERDEDRDDGNAAGVRTVKGLIVFAAAEHHLTTSSECMPAM